MTSPTSCPELDRWKRLLEGTLRADEQAALNGHLEWCAACRAVVEQLTAADARWLQWARQLGETDTALDLALQRVIEEAKADTYPGETLPEQTSGDDQLLPFLDPSNDPAHLGRLENYEIVEALGRGGMGVVLKAFDESLHRIVAIKVMAPQLAASPNARKRFLREARAAAGIRDEHVVTIHAVAEANGLPYLVMEYIQGSSLQQRLDRYGVLELKEVLRIGMQAAVGLAAAHKQGLIHRDIKPANIMLENGVERVKLTDFGLARAADNNDLSSGGLMIGTPQYMAPEQARGEPLDHRADLFSLGSVLYAMCTGQSPFGAGSVMGILKRVSEDMPRPIGELNPDIPQWLVEIIGRLHAKNPADRFPSAAEVAGLLSRHLAALQQPTLDLPGSLIPTQPVAQPAPQPVPKLAGRVHRTRWAIGLAAVLFLAVGIGLTESLGLTGLTQYLSRRPRPEGLVTTTSDPGNLPPSREPVSTLPVQAGIVWSVAFSPDGELLATANQDASVRFWKRKKVRAWQPEATLRSHVGGVRSVAFAPDGNLLATGSIDRSVKIWRRVGDTWQEAVVLETEVACAVAFAPDGKSLATAAGLRQEPAPATPRLWDPITGQEQGALSGHDSYVAALAFSPDGNTLATASGDATVKLWDPATGRCRSTLNVEAGELCSLAFAPDGNTLAVASVDCTIRLWQKKEGRWQERATLQGHAGEVRSVAFSPNGSILASASLDQTVRLWDPRAAIELAVLQGHDREADAVAFAPDGNTLASGGWDATVRLWDMTSWYRTRAGD